MENNNETIKPVELAQNISKLNTVKRREKRKQKFTFSGQDQKEKKNETAKEKPQPDIDEKFVNTQHTVDYKA
jgi:hypothetical protein